MPTDHRTELKNIRTFPQLVRYLRDEMGWPIEQDSFEDDEDLYYDFTPEELGLDTTTAAKIEQIRRLKRLSANQPWGIFFVKFAPGRLPIIALRRILNRVVLKKRATAKAAERTAWAADDLLFVSNYGEGNERQISFAHFSQADTKHDLPTLKVLGWDNLDTPLHLDDAAEKLTTNLAWPEDETDIEAWRKSWRSAFVLRHREVVTTSHDLSIRLAELARTIRDRIKTALAHENERGLLTKLMKSFQESLIHDLDATGFADMYAQTITYGLLSARIADPHKKTADDFAAHMRTNPFLRELMEIFLHVGGRRGKAGGPGIDFDELGVNDVVELLDDANMEAVVRDFGDKNPQEDPVTHFYEGFAKEYDPIDKVRRGEFYTPRPVVSYIVRSVDELLRNEFDLADGLADTTTWGELAKRHKGLKIPDGVDPGQAFIQILDPATGTGTFLVEVIDLIHKTMVVKWKAQGHDEKKIESLWNEYVPRYLLPRLYAYELKMAPYAIAHLKIGLKLYETGYRFGSDKRARIYLTNALESSHDFSGTFQFAIPALAHEAQAVNEVKKRQRFTVVIGNPPYSRHSSNPSKDTEGHLTFIGRLVEDYKEGCPELRKPAQAKYLQDDYVKFIRLAEYCIETAGFGIVGFITNHGFLDNPTFRGMRKHLLNRLSRIRVLDLHGNTNKKERAPDGSDDKNVFDIKQGVAILVGVRAANTHDRDVFHGELWGTRENKYRNLSIARKSLSATLLNPKPPHFSLRPRDETNEMEYLYFPSIPEIFSPNGAPAPGIVTTHDSFAVAFTEKEIIANVETLLSTKNEDQARQHFRLCTQNQWNYAVAKKALADGKWRKKIIPLHYRPFDTRFTVYDSNVAVHRRERVTRHLFGGENVALLTSRMTKGETFKHAQVTRLVPEVICMSPQTSNNGFVFPLWLKRGEAEASKADLFGDKKVVNFGREFLERISLVLGAIPSGSFGVPDGLKPEDIFNYIYAVLHSPGYRSRYAEFLKIDFPRLPLTGNLELFRALARLGGELVALHLLESPNLDQPITEFKGGRIPEVEKVSWSKNTVWVDKAQTIGFRDVPEAMWNFHIGGYQVCEKWLKDRKGRTLTKDDITHYQKIVVALNETIRLMKEIDEVIEQHGGWPRAFQTGEAQAAAPKVIPFRPRIVQPSPKERYVTCVPLVPLKAAAGAFSDPQYIDDDGFEWAAVETKCRLRPGMFVAQVVGKSMEPAIPDGSYCLFTAPVEGTRQGKTVLVQLRDATDPESGERYTVKRYESEKAQDGDLWHHATITLKPVNPDFKLIVLTGADEGQLQVIAEVVEVLGGGT